MSLRSKTKSGALGFTLAMTLVAGAAGAEPFRLIVTDLEPPLVPNSITDLAVELGYFEKEGVEVELVRVQQTPSAIAALQAGEGDMANISVSALVRLVLSGSDDLRAVTSPNKSLPFLIASKDDIERPEDLAGKAFGVGRVGSLDYSLSSSVVQTYGLSVDDLQIVALGQPAVRGQALAAGQVDATTMSIGVWSSLPDKSGLKILVSQDEYYEAAPVVNKVNAVSLDTIENRADDLQAVLRGLVKASRDVSQDGSIWVNFMQEVRPDISADVLGMLADSFSQSWSVNGGLNREELAFTQSWLYEGEDFAGARVLDLAEWVDFGPIDQTLEALGTAEGTDQPVR